MNAAADSLALELLRSMRSDIAYIRIVQREHSVRLKGIAASVAGLRRDQASDAEASAHLAARVDWAFDEIDQIKRRIDLVD